MNAALQAAPFALFLFILPFPGTVSLRLLCLAAAFVIALACLRRWSPPRLPCKAALLAWALVCAAAVAYSFDVGYSMGEFKNEIVYAFMAFWAFFVFAQGPRELAIALGALVSAVTVIVLWGTAGALENGTWIEDAGHGGSGSVSTYLAVVAPLCAIALFAQPGKRARWALWMVLVLIFIGALATRQRILWPIFVLEGALGAWLLRRTGRVSFSRRPGLVVLIASAACATALVFGLQQWREHSNQVRPFGVDARLTVWPKVLAQMAEQPWTGAGLGRQAMRSTHPDWVPAEDPQVWHGHNVVLNAGISMGVPGMLVLLFLFTSLFAAYARLTKSEHPIVRLVGIAGILALVGVLGRNMTNDFFVRDGALLFWAVNGALLGAALRQLHPARTEAA